MPNQTQSAATVRALDRTWGQRWKAGDVGFIECLYDPMWHYVTRRGVSDKAHDMLQSKRFALSHPHFVDDGKVLSLNVYMKGDFAAATGYYQAKDGSRSRWTDFFQWNDHRWIAVFSQAS